MQSMTPSGINLMSLNPCIHCLRSAHVCLQGVTFPCVNHVKSDENDGDTANASDAVSHPPKLASYAFRKKAVHKLEELLQIMQRETSVEAGSTDAASAV